MDLRHLQRDDLHLIVDVGSGAPVILHWGPDPGPLDGVDPATFDRPRAPATLDRPAPSTLLTTAASGFAGRPGVEYHRDRPLLPRFDASSFAVHGTTRLTFDLHDTAARVHVAGSLEVGPVLAIDVAIRNDGDRPLFVDHLAPSLPLPDDSDEVLRLTGQWCAEFQPRRVAWDAGIHLVETRRGRTGHDSVPLGFAGPRGFGEHHGDVRGVHLAWSGNHTTRFERLPDGRRFVQSGALLTAGEIALGPGEVFHAPRVLATAGTGLTECSQRLHAHVREGLPTSVRPVVLNTWEAVYFDHDLERLRALADRAARVGVERFVLDDGWFGDRRDDTAGLGDWFVSPDAHPEGLAPLIDHVTALGMDFGIWVEPEMVNADSELYRSHPDWVLGDPELTGRNQLVLDLTVDECWLHVHGALDELLGGHEIGFVKWDMNRDVIAAGTHAQTLAVYRMLDSLRDRHPGVEIESCASGGGRADAGILRRTERIWTSDCNDPLERQTIQRGFSMYLPPEVMGAHIGPPRAHTTGRTHRLAFRAATALFGHLGIEWNLLEASDRELDRLGTWIALHKELRPLLHGGDVVRLDPPDDASLAHGVVARDRSEAVVSFAQLATSGAPTPPMLRLPGLDPERRYRVERIRVPGDVWGLAYEQPSWTVDGAESTGRALAQAGVAMPRLFPESAVLLRVRAVS